MSDPRPVEEREVKLAANPDLRLPSFDSVLDAVEVAADRAVVLDATYWDTADLRLIRSGVSLRHRTRDGAKGTWTVKVPAGGGAAGAAGAGALVRTEIDRPGPAGRPPADVARLVAAHVRAAELVPVARLVTTRTRRALRRHGVEVGEIDDDLVEVIDRDEVVARFREIELEVGPEVTDHELGLAVAALRDAGAGAPDPTPKVARALGPRALAAPDLRVPVLDPGARAGELVGAGLGTALGRVVAAHHVACATGDPAAVAALRAATRRARNVLRLASPLLEGPWADQLADELGWLAASVRDVRRLDARQARLRRALDAAARRDPGAAVDLGELVDRLVAPRDAAWRSALEVLGSPRYRGLLEALARGAAAPPVLAPAALAVDVWPAVVDPEWRRLRHRALAALDLEPATDHRAHGALRTSARRVRVGAELLDGLAGGGPPRLADALGDVGRALAVRRDALDLAVWLREEAVDLAGAPAAAVERLVAAELAAAERADGRWRRAWSRADRPRATRWLGS